MNIHEYLSYEQLDFFTEMMNIGSGNASSALSQLLGCAVDIETPKVQLLSFNEVLSQPTLRTLSVACVSMFLVGDIPGDMHFLISNFQKAYLSNLLERTVPSTYKLKSSDSISEWNKSVIEEIANIYAGTYLQAINTFCGLNIYHTVPVLKFGEISTLFDTSSKRLDKEGKIIVVKNNLVVNATPLETYVLINFSLDFRAKINKAFAEAEKRLGKK